MNAPGWLNSVLRDFGEAVGVNDFGFNAQDAASILFENGVSLRFEYAFSSLAIMVQVPMAGDFHALKLLLSYAHFERRPQFRLRTSYLPKASAGILVARLPEREVTLPAINTVFTELWRLAEDLRRRAS